MVDEGEDDDCEGCCGRCYDEDCDHGGCDWFHEFHGLRDCRSVDFGVVAGVDFDGVGVF